MTMRGRPTQYQFDERWFLIILDLVIQNYTFKRISAKAGMPPVNVFYYWSKKYPCLRKAVSAMKKERSLFKKELELQGKFTRLCIEFPSS